MRELAALIEMFVKESKAYILANLFYLLFFPVAITLGFSYVVRGPYAAYFVAGTAVLEVSVATTLSVANWIAMDRDRGRLSFVMSTGVPSWGYAVSASFVNSVFAIATAYIVFLAARSLGLVELGPEAAALALPALVASSFEGAMLGLLLASWVRNFRLLTQLSQVVTFVLVFFAPVYYPVAYVPPPLRPLVYLEPTTPQAMAVRLALAGSPLSLAWSAASAAYGVALLLAARTRGLM